MTLTAWFSNRERGRFYGIWSTAHSMGEGLTYYVVALFVAWLGWRAGFWVPGLFCILAGIGIYALMQDRPPTLGPAARSPTGRTITSPSSRRRRRAC